MCGIAGMLGDIDVARGRAMLHALGHRGPDGRGEFTGRGVWLGHARLSILDPTPAGAQPVVSPCGGVALVLNGEVFNHGALAATLADRRPLTSRSDAEVVLRGYLREGVPFLERLEGIFALALADLRGGDGPARLVLARDPIGVKPLLYHRGPERLTFASELGALLRGGVCAPRIDPGALEGLLHLGAVPQPRTLVRDVHALAPGAVVVLDRPVAPRARRFIPVRDELPTPPRTRGEAVDAVAAHLRRAVALQTADRNELTLFLSGGVDSALLAALAKGEGKTPQALTLSLSGADPRLDESAAAARTAAALDIPHEVVRLTDAQVRDRFAHFITRIDQPTVDGFNTFLLSSAVSRGERVVLSGTGPDELFCGYTWVRDIIDALGAEARPSPHALAREWLARCTLPVARTLAARGLGDRRGRDGSTARRDLLATIAAIDPGPAAPVAARLRRVCLHRFTLDRLLRDLDVCTMAFGLEGRVPFLDPSLVALAEALDVRHLVSPARRGARRPPTYGSSGLKRLVVEAARRWLPMRLFARRGKWGFILPHGVWLAGPLRDVMRRALSDEALRETGVLCPVRTARLRRAFAARGVHANDVWLAVVLQSWCLHWGVQA